MKSLTGRIPSARGWALLLTMFLGAGLMIAACGDEEAPTPTTPAPAPAPTPTPPPAPEPEPTPDPPAVPTGLVVAERGADFIEWKWTPVEGAAGYEVQFSANEAFTDEDEVVNRTAEQITYRRTGLDAEANAYLRVRAYVGEGDGRVRSAWSTHVTGMTTAPEPELPATPANLRILNAGSDYIIWTWDRVAGASGYEVQFSRQAVITDNDPKSVVTGIASTTHRVANLPSSTNGYLRVRAWSGTISAPVNGAWTGSVRGTTDEPPPAVPLSRPGNVRSTGRDEDSITLEWNEVEDADHYLVRQRVATATAWSNASCGGGDHIVEDTSCVASGLDEGVAYDFQVRAVPDSSDATAEASEWSAEIEATTVGAAAPTTPGGSGELNIRWRSGGSTGLDVIFIWDRVADAEYDTALLTTASYTASSTPCPASGATGATGWVPQGVKTTQTITAGARGEVEGLCVRTKDQKNVSFAWGASTPVMPKARELGDGGSETHNNRRTTSLIWTDLSSHDGFTDTIRVAERGLDGGAAVAINAAASGQKACDEGHFVSQDSASRSLTGLDQSWSRSLRPYRAYMMCVKFANTAGETEWAVPGGHAAIATRPAAPPSPSVAVNENASNTLITWSIGDRADLPEDEDDYGAKTIRYPERWDDDGTMRSVPAPRVAQCELAVGTHGTHNQWIVAETPPDDPRPTRHGISISYSSDGVERNPSGGEDLRVHLCLRAKTGDGRFGPWVISSGTEVRKLPSSN